MKRAAICIGVDRAGSMDPLRAAAKGARDFANWAEHQECDTTLLIDTHSPVALTGVFDAVRERVDAGTYDQLIVYFSGHGILQAPDAEYWLLSSAPDNPNEAVNLYRAIAEGRNSGIPHVVFVSDACRSSVSGPPLSGVTGGGIFPNRPYGLESAEVDVFYAARPGDPAYEVPGDKASSHWRGLFTHSLLTAVASPRPDWIEIIDDADQRAVITARKLKPFLEKIVPEGIAEIDLLLNQQPVVRVETALPKFFAVVDTQSVNSPSLSSPPSPDSPSPRTSPSPVPAPSRSAPLRWLRDHFSSPFRHSRRRARASEATRHEAQAHAEVERVRQSALPLERARLVEATLQGEVQKLVRTRGRDHFETQTGFTVFGVRSVRADAAGWQASTVPQSDDPDVVHIRLSDGDLLHGPGSIVLAFDGGTGSVLPILPGFIGTIVIERGRTISVNYVPSANNWRFFEYEQRRDELERMKAVTAVEARNGRFVIANQSAAEFASHIRQAKGIDPTMGVYAAYAYAQVGRYADAYGVYTHMSDDIELPVPFDVLMLARRHRPDAHARYAPFAPILTQGWSLLTANDPLHEAIHHQLRPHLVPSLWTTLDPAGVEIARNAIMLRSRQ